MVALVRMWHAFFLVGSNFSDPVYRRSIHLLPLPKSALAAAKSPLRRSTVNHTHIIHAATVLQERRSDNHQLPGAFANNTIFLQGIRLTISYEESVNDLHVDLFGFPGDLTRLIDEVIECQDITANFNETLLGRKELEENVALYCQLDPVSRDNFSYHAPLVPMFFLPVISVDVNQDNTTMLWRCNITECMSRSQLKNFVETHGGNSFLVVHVWMMSNHDLHNIHEVTKIASFRISLDTGALGVGNPLFRGGVAKSYFQQNPVSAGLCVATHGKNFLQYIRQFVQHHLNVGFGSILIGVRGSENGDVIQQAQRILQNFIGQGVVALAHYDSPFPCDDDTRKVQFYTSCLYYHKGLTPYSATWDVDEFWAPPDVLIVDGRHNERHYQMMGVDLDFVLVNASTSPEEESKPGVTQNSSSWSTFPQFIQDDPLWQSSPYAKSVSIADTLMAIEKFYSEHGCHSSFCFHTFPSRVVFLRDTVNERNRSKHIGRDFEMRKVRYDNEWHKSVVNTKYSYSSGFHVGGTCNVERYVDASLPYATLKERFDPVPSQVECSPRRFEHDVYGSMHHFVDLFEFRWSLYGPKDPTNNITQLDEYVAVFAPTVELQLARDDKNNDSIDKLLCSFGSDFIHTFAS